MHHLYQQKTVSRDELVQRAREDIHSLTERINSEPIAPEICELMLQLSDKLSALSGKKQYGYLPKNTKKLVNEIVDELAQNPTIHACYDTWWELQMQLRDYYGGERLHQPRLSEQKEFRAIKKAIIREAASLPMQNFTPRQPDAAPVLISAAKLVANLGRVFEDSVQPQQGQQLHTDRKLLQKIRAKKMAMGQSDHEISY